MHHAFRKRPALGGGPGLPILQLAAIYWPGLGVAHRTVPLTAAELEVATAADVAPVAVVEVVKLVLRWSGNRRDLAAEGRTSSGSSRAH
jgi:hypothetical protein